MTTETMLADVALRTWKQNADRVVKFFANQTEDQLQREVAPGRNRLIYILGHLVAVNDALLPLLGFGPRLHPDLDEVFVKSPDRAVATLPSGEDLKRFWTEVDEALSRHFASLTPAQWVEKHASVSTEAFAREPHRNRFNVLLSRIGHMQQHMGQAVLADPRKS